MKALTRLMMAALCVVAAVAAPARAADQAPKAVQRATDPVTGAEVRVSQGRNGTLSLELAAPGLTLTKQAKDGVVTTVVRVAKDELKIEARRDLVIVSGRGGRVEVPAARPDRLAAAQALIARSPAVADAVRLLGRMSIGHDSPLGLTLLSTRALLLAARNDVAGLKVLAGAVAALRERPVLTRVAWQSSPTDCWNKYAIEAIAAWREYEDCTRNSGFWGDLACAALYDMRAVGAFTWWLKCSAISG